MHKRKLRNHIIRSGSRLIEIGTLLILLLSASAVYGETGENQPDEASQLQGSEATFGQIKEEQNQEDLGIFGLSLEEMMNVKVDVASLFIEGERVVGSTVSSISPSQWKKLGARRVSDALANELSVVTYPHLVGMNTIAIRGYATDSLSRGTAYIIDGVPLNEFMGSSIPHVPDFGLGTLNRIELIKGPGSAIYGSDAFHGVVSMKTFESDVDHYSVELAGAYPLYGDTNVKLSKGFKDNLFRLNVAVNTSGQRAHDQKYEYYHPGLDSPDLTIQPSQGTGTREVKYESHSGVFKLNITPSDKLELKLGSYINTSDFSGYPGLVYSTSMGGSIEGFDSSMQENKLYIGNGSAIYTFNNKLSIELNGYYFSNNQDGGIYQDLYGSIDLTDSKSSRAGTNLIVKQPDNAINLQWLIAYSFTKMEVDRAKFELESHNPAIPSKPEENQLYDGKSRNINSVYAQTKWGVIKESLYILLGGRLDHYSDYGDQFTPRGGLIFLPTDKSSIKALYGRAFRAGSALEIHGTEPYANENRDLKPETIDIYELIYMYKDKKLKVNANGFYSTWKDGIVVEVDLSNYFITGRPIKRTNSGKNRSYGGEFSVLYSFKPFAIDFGLSYTESKAIDTKKSLLASELVDLEYVAFPKYIANVGFHYTLSPNKIKFFLNNRFYYKMKETHYNRTSSPEIEPEELPIYWRMDLNISKATNKNTEFTINIRNLLDRKNYIPSLSGAKKGLEEPGISILFRVNYKF